jgi:hypothetical protein
MAASPPWRNGQFPARRTEDEICAMLVEAHKEGVVNGRADWLAGDPVMGADAAEFWARLRISGLPRFDESGVPALSTAYLAGYREQVRRVIGSQRPSSRD